jgi:hypothetical protein
LSVTLKVGGVVTIVCVLSVALAGCGSGGSQSSSNSHTYVVTPPANSGVSGIYVTIVSPVAIPTSLLTKNGARVGGHPAGPQKCSYTKKAQGMHGKWAGLNGKTVTLKVNGSSPFASRVCSTLKSAAFTPSLLGGA